MNTSTFPGLEDEQKSGEECEKSVGSGGPQKPLVKNARKGREWSAGLGVSEITLVWKVVPITLMNRMLCHPSSLHIARSTVSNASSPLLQSGGSDGNLGT